MTNVRTAVVTGGNSGIGRAVVDRLCREDVEVFSLDLRKGEADLPASVSWLETDVTSKESVDAAFAEVESVSGRLSAVVNAAGIVNPVVPSQDLSQADWNELLGIHLSGTFFVCQRAYRSLSVAGGTIVNVASIAAHVGRKHRPAYSAAKGGIEALTRTLAVEWAGVGIRVNAVAPGVTLTPPVRQRFEDGVFDQAGVSERIPIGRFAEPEEIADVIWYLSSSQSSYVTGQAVVVDGGLIINGEFG